MIDAALVGLLLLADPCVDATPACRSAAQSAILLWRTRAGTVADALEACETKRLARTPEAIAALVPPQPEPPAPAWPWIVTGGLAGAAVAALAFFLGSHL